MYFCTRFKTNCMQRNITKSTLNNFHVIGLLLSAKFLFSTQNNSILLILSLISSLLIIYALFYTTTRFRDTECDRSISYLNAFKYIFLLYFFGSIVLSIIIWIYTQFINKEFLDLTLDLLLKTYENLKIHVDNQTYSILEKIFKPLPYSIFNLFASIFSSLFWSSILAIFIKKEKSIFE